MNEWVILGENTQAQDCSGPSHVNLQLKGILSRPQKTWPFASMDHCRDGAEIGIGRLKGLIYSTSIGDTAAGVKKTLGLPLSTWKSWKERPDSKYQITARMMIKMDGAFASEMRYYHRTVLGIIQRSNQGHVGSLKSQSLCSQLLHYPAVRKE